MAHKQLTDLDKLECVEYMLDILGNELHDGDFGWEASLWVQRGKDECAKRRSQYLTSVYRTMGGEL